LRRGDRVHVEAFVTHVYDANESDFAELVEVRVPGAMDSIFMSNQPNFLVPRARVHRDVRALTEDP
jgi:hypothetical protein